MKKVLLLLAALHVLKYDWNKNTILLSRKFLMAFFSICFLAAPPSNFKYLLDTLTYIFLSYSFLSKSLGFIFTHCLLSLPLAICCYIFRPYLCSFSVSFPVFIFFLLLTINIFHFFSSLSPALHVFSFF